MELDRVSHVCVPGTFDPVTYGHLDVIRRSCHLFDRVTVAVAASYSKNGTGRVFSLDERVAMIREAVADDPDCSNVEVMGFEGLLVDLSIVRELAALGRDVSFLVPRCVEERLATRFGRA